MKPNITEFTSSMYEYKITGLKINFLAISSQKDICNNPLNYVGTDRNEVIRWLGWSVKYILWIYKWPEQLANCGSNTLKNKLHDTYQSCITTWLYTTEHLALTNRSNKFLCTESIRQIPSKGSVCSVWCRYDVIKVHCVGMQYLNEDRLNLYIVRANPLITLWCTYTVTCRTLLIDFARAPPGIITMMASVVLVALFI